MTNLTIVKPAPRITPPDLSKVMVMQEEFNRLYEVPVNSETEELYVKLIEEEHEEWIEEYYKQVPKEFDELKELADVLYVTAGLAFVMGYNINIATRYSGEATYDFAITKLVSDIATGNVSRKVLTTLIYCLYGYANQMNWDLDEAYRRVHISNLSKLGVDGKPVLREDGKVTKGPNYKPPYLEDLTDGR